LTGTKSSSGIRKNIRTNGLLFSHSRRFLNLLAPASSDSDQHAGGQLLEAGTILTLNHGHAALLGAFGMLAMALVVLGLRHVLTDEQWAGPEKFIKVSFWGLNVGLALMVITNLFPVGVLQIWDVLENGYWHARSLEFIGQDRIRLLEWAGCRRT
jgi:hypothetical protein